MLVPLDGAIDKMSDGLGFVMQIIILQALVSEVRNNVAGAVRFSVLVSHRSLFVDGGRAGEGTRHFPFVVCPRLRWQRQANCFDFGADGMIPDSKYRGRCSIFIPTRIYYRVLEPRMFSDVLLRCTTTMDQHRT